MAADTENKRSGDTLTDFLLDDIKKRFGLVWEHIDEKASALSSMIADVEKQSMSSCGSLVKEINDLKDSLGDTSDNSFNAINMCKSIEVDLKRLMPILDNIKVIQDNLDSFQKEVVSCFGELDKDREYQSKKVSDFMKASATDYNELSNKVVDIESMIGEQEKSIDSFEPVISDLKEEIDLLKSFHAQDKEDSKMVINEFRQVSSKIEDVNRLAGNNHAALMADMGALRGEMTVFAEKGDLASLEQKIKSIEEKLEKRSVMAPSPKDELNSSWKQQMELKLGRIEKKIG